ncbi:hybrid sensor histidine kinase/response regulator transcription factor [Larkinella soli]|uniref:hybrid sensor histidine kinase/response regulator transcription factor n=1 Tax=Larkinella soli TaxID=1770527 RepID=UPI0013E32549|nr:ATP-binding protein [Larkinella soli]
MVDLKLDQQGQLWISDDQGEIDLFDPQREKFINYTRQPFYQRHFGRDTLHYSFPDRQNRLWLSFRQGGLALVDRAKNTVRRFHHRPDQPQSLGNDTIQAIVQDRQGTIWLATSDGLDRFEERTGQFTHYRHQPGNPNSIPDNDLKGLHLRRNGDLLILSKQHATVFRPQTGQFRSFPLPVVADPGAWWYGSHATSDSQGNDYFDQNNLVFRFNEQEGPQLVIEPKEIDRSQSLFVDRSDVLWIGTNGQGVRKYNLKTGLFHARPYASDFGNDLLRRHLGLPADRTPYYPPGEGQWSYNFRYTVDGAGKLWYNVTDVPFYQIDLATKQLKPVSFPFKGHLGWEEKLAPLATDPSGRVWCVHALELRWFEQGEWKLFPHPLGPKIQAKILQMVVDEQAAWLATATDGLYRVDRATGQIRQFAHNPQQPGSLSSDKLLCLFADPADHHVLWIGTYGSGLCRFDKRTGTCRRLAKRDGLPNNVIYAAIPDQRGNLWVATNQGLCRLNRRTFRTRTFTHEDGLPGDEFNRFHFLHLPDDRIILGGMAGTIDFYPSQIRDDTYQPQIEVTGIQINNRRVEPGPGSPIDSIPVQLVQHLDLPYDQNFLTVEFAALQYNSHDRLRYRYQLEGIDKDWIIAERPEAIYTNLSPGTYALNLNGSNTSGVWSTHIRTMTITIHPPFWATWWAYLFYTLTIGGIAVALFRAYLKQKEAEQLKTVDEMKTRFFSNITHEFRTPLTLILAPAEQLSQTLNDPENLRRVATIHRNAHQLLGLVNQLMDLTRLDAQAVQVEEARGNPVFLIEQIVQSFAPQAEAKSIQLRFESADLHDEYFFDVHKLERIAYNLIMNALKFTPAGGAITVGLAPAVTLTVADTGIGIPADKLPYIFDRFYQVDDSSTRRQEGTGIGLALVKELVELQKGRIDVVSEVGGGTTFTVQLPYRPALSFNKDLNSSQKPVLDPIENRSEEEPILLLVEDNDELAEFIIDSLPDGYQVHRAAHGADGLEKAVQLIPDLIISDVLMPVMDGYTFCQNLKSDQRTSHIPVVLLTAKSSHDSRITGLKLGADDYITKPFHLQELQLRVRNLLEQRRKLREWIRATLIHPEPLLTESASETTDPFIDTIYGLIENHLDDSSFGADQLIKLARMSRMSLHRKLKALTGMSASELIRTYRLKRATNYLEQGYNSSETAYRVGFESPAYFTKCFRELYQQTPTEFAASRTRKPPFTNSAEG